MKPLVIYHANCADGFGAAFAAWMKLGDEAEYVPMLYNQHFPPIDCNDRDIYILDFSFDRQRMDVLFSRAKRVVWLDHHKTAFEMWVATGYLDKYSSFTNLSEPHHIILDNNKSGAYLAWEYFHPGEEVPLFIRHIDDYDRWQFKLDGTKAFNKALWSYAPWSFPQWVEWFYDCEAVFNHTYWADFYTEGEAILRAHEQNVQSVVKGSARACKLIIPVDARNLVASYNQPNWIYDQDARYATASVEGLAANCPPHLTSDVGHELATKSGTFGLCWTLSQTGLVAKCSLRSNGEYDVSAIAKVFGGGGHRNAAGFEVDIHTLLGWLK